MTANSFVKQWTIALLLLLAASSVLSAAEPNGDVELTASVDWRGGRLRIEARCPLQEPIGPKSRFLAEKRIEEKISDAVLQAAWNLTVDSTRLLGEVLLEDPEALQKVRAFALRGVKESASYGRSMREVLVRYSYPLFGTGGLTESLVTHTRSFPLRRVPGFVPTARFSGVVICVQGELERYAERETAAAIPSLFPKIYDEQMRLVLSREMCDPDALRRWGMIAYSDDLDLLPFVVRIGSFPLTVLATGVYGSKPADIIIPTESAARLLSLEENRDLLEQGRILVIYDDLANAELF